ncbi:Mannosyl-oligosaccharide alpha-1,2-mannosidase [Ceratocystis fimbriata CBS 114723]|uniref:alpha-1,2-Mannosidase n=1 Tax=Ceratocystis fimbriata CBS 114723 TaxID=1035309 RepID=A0A2C5XH91_9PEZI|nr:Mannosyl-oligosaccharide alpha-1,2-mannosidase [Ceratocystis fimbriata CBS 114723]
MFMRPRKPVLTSLFFLTVVFYSLYAYRDYLPRRHPAPVYTYIPSSYDWSKHEHRFPVPREQMASPPLGHARKLPSVQHSWTRGEAIQQARSASHMRKAVVAAFQKTYASYERLAFGHDELAPLSHVPKDPFNGWGATIVDSLDTLWLMGLRDEWERAVAFVAMLDWNKPTGTSCNLFETGIRFLGGLIAAHDLSGEPVLLRKAVELADMMYAAWDNAAHLPRGRFTWAALKANGEGIQPLNRQSIAGIGTFTLEFTRLSIITGDAKYYDAVHRISQHFNRTQNDTLLPGLWPVHINALENFGVDDSPAVFHYGASADSAYEYFPKMHALLGGQEPMYEHMYRTSTDLGIRHLVYRPMLPAEDDVLFMGSLKVERDNRDVSGIPEPKYTFTPSMDHLTCFVGGMMLLGGKLIDEPRHVHVGEKLALGCATAYRLVHPSQLMPEQATFVQCESTETCSWDAAKWEQAVSVASAAAEKPPASNADASAGTAQPKTPPGIAHVVDPKYILRPEAIESIFIMWRTTGDQRLQLVAQDMWTAITRACEGETAFAAIKDVTQDVIQRVDSMESFFLAETLKYFFLIFSNPEIVSLDEWVFNTEAHPFKREQPGKNT